MCAPPTRPWATSSRTSARASKQNDTHTGTGILPAPICRFRGRNACSIAKRCCRLTESSSQSIRFPRCQASLLRNADEEETGRAQSVQHLGVCCLCTVDNARCLEAYQSASSACSRRFWTARELFFGFYRTDGMHLSRAAPKGTGSGDSGILSEIRGQRKISEHLSVARCELNDRVYARIPASVDYYLETTLFVPKDGLGNLCSNVHAGYQEHRLEDMILNALCRSAVLLCGQRGFFSLL